MGPGQIVPGIGALLSSLGSLYWQNRALENTEKLNTIGGTGDVLRYNPEGTGTGWEGLGADYVNTLEGNERLGQVNAINRWYQQSPGTATSYFRMMDDLAESQRYQQQAAQSNVDLYKNSALPDIQSNLMSLREEVAARARERADNPNVITQAEMDAIIGRAIGNTNQAYASQGAAANQEVGRRGMSRDAAGGIQQQLQAANRQEQLAKIADVAAMNAQGRTQNQQNAEAMLAGVGGLDQLLAGINTQYNADLSNARNVEAALHQPLPWNVIGESMDQRAISQALLESGAYGDASNLLMGIASNMGSFYDQAAARSWQYANANSDWENFWGGGGSGVVGAGIGAGLLGAGAIGAGAGALGGGGLTALSPFLLMSDVNSKALFKPINQEAILSALNALPITTWHYKDEPQRPRHIGPMAQDFHRAFGFGNDDTTIPVVDAIGVAYAAIQALRTRVVELERRLAESD